MLRAPPVEPALQRPELPDLEAAGMAAQQLRKHRLGLELKLRDRIKRLSHELEAEGWAVCSIALHRLLLDRLKHLGEGRVESLIERERALAADDPALEHLTEIIADNFHLRIEGDGVTHQTVTAAIERIAEDAFGSDLATWDRILAALPPNRIVALDVETTLVDRDLCTLQLGTPAFNAIVDASVLADLASLAVILEHDDILKVIHNASFERSVLGRLNLSITNVFDTLATSRRLRGRTADGGHSLAACCRRELGLELDKSEQTSDWTRRPLSARQLAYAALDVEVLIALHGRFSTEILV
ncbi:MAG: hypothetical protein ACK5U8_32070 [Deltaproteobacteria bacterium]